MTWTPYTDLDELLAELLEHWRRILGENFAGAYVQGSFALGAGDEHSDCDWLVVTKEPLAADQEVALRALHDDIPTRAGHWPHDLEGSYAPLADLQSIAHLGRAWLFNNHGHRTLEWSDHCNKGYTRWILREHGIVLAGPAPRSFMAQVPNSMLRAEAAREIATQLDDTAAWLDIDGLAWGQRYLVVSACRTLFTLATARVASKAGALEWAQRTLDPRWRPLLAQVRDDRSRGWDPSDQPRPGSADAARAFSSYAVGWADAHGRSLDHARRAASTTGPATTEANRPRR